MINIFKSKRTGKELVNSTISGITTLVEELDVGISQVEAEHEATKLAQEEAKAAWERQNESFNQELIDLTKVAQNGKKLKQNIANLLK